MNTANTQPEQGAHHHEASNMTPETLTPAEALAVVWELRQHFEDNSLPPDELWARHKAARGSIKRAAAPEAKKEFNALGSNLWRRRYPPPPSRLADQGELAKIIEPLLKDGGRLLATEPPLGLLVAALGHAVHDLERGAMKLPTARQLCDRVEQHLEGRDDYKLLAEICRQRISLSGFIDLSSALGAMLREAVMASLPLAAKVSALRDAISKRESQERDPICMRIGQRVYPRHEIDAAIADIVLGKHTPRPWWADGPDTL